MGDLKKDKRGEVINLTFTRKIGGSFWGVRVEGRKMYNLTEGEKFERNAKVRSHQFGKQHIETKSG